MQKGGEKVLGSHDMKSAFMAALVALLISGPSWGAADSGKYFVERVQVTKLPHVTSDTIVKRVTDALKIRTKEHLHGKSPVVLLVLINRLTTPTSPKRLVLPLLGYTSKLAGSIRLTDKASKKLLTKYPINAAYTDPRIPYPVKPREVEKFEIMVINRFVTLVVRKLKQGN
jgi:hypothetical protein